MSQIVEWLDVSGRRPGPRTQIHLSLKGPLYAASAVFKRDIASDGRWSIHARAEAALPFRPKWSDTIEARGDFNQTSTFDSHIESVSTNSHAIRWERDGSNLYLNKGAAGEESAIDVVNIPVVSAADLIFLLQDVWPAMSAARGFFAVASRKIFAVRLEGTDAGKILGRIAGVESPGQVSNWSDAHHKAIEGKAYDFLLGWSEADRVVTSLEVKLPVLGRVRAQFS